MTTVLAMEQVPLGRRRYGKWEPKFNLRLTLSCGHAVTVPGDSKITVGHEGPCPACNLPKRVG